MDASVCASAICTLEKQGGPISFPLITLAGLVGGVNPCAIGMVILLLGYLLVFAKKPGKILPLGGAYILTIYLTYIAIGFFFFKSARLFALTSWRLLFINGVASLLLLAGLINIKDFFFPQSPIHLEIPQRLRKKFFALIEKTSLLAIIVLAILVTILGTPCSLLIYVGTATMLANAGLSQVEVVGYFLYYNFLFVLPLFVILFLTWKGRQIVDFNEWEHRHKRKMKLSLGLLLVLMAVYFLLFQSRNLL